MTSFLSLSVSSAWVPQLIGHQHWAFIWALSLDEHGAIYARRACRAPSLLCKQEVAGSSPAGSTGEGPGKSRFWVRRYWQCGLRVRPDGSVMEASGFHPGSVPIFKRTSIWTTHGVGGSSTA
jgi:hypothetical protein